jgi:tripartite-type tricarboxylate transporter receptor subunit TctC
MRELGVDAEFYSWLGLFAPAGLPSDVAATLRNAVRQAARDGEFRKSMEGMNSVINNLDGAEFEAFLERDTRRLGSAIQKIGKTQ